MKKMMTTLVSTRGLNVSRDLMTLILSVFCLSLIGLSSAWGHQCRLMKHDKRNLCLAREENARFYCTYIKDPDQQRYCFAYVDITPKQCESISDETLKTQCSTEVQARFEAAEAKRKAQEEATKAQEEAAKAQEEARKAAEAKRGKNPGQGGSGR